jgi:hypothetical protein
VTAQQERIEDRFNTAIVPQRESRRRPVLAFADGFDLLAARQVLAATLLREAASVVVDLTHTRNVHDSAVAALAAIAVRVSVPVTVRGLREHHLRLLRYLGFESEEIFRGEDRWVAEQNGRRAFRRLLLLELVVLSGCATLWSAGPDPLSSGLL